jgi:hypothetical protein
VQELPGGLPLEPARALRLPARRADRGEAGEQEQQRPGDVAAGGTGHGAQTGSGKGSINVTGAVPGRQRALVRDL